jgi:hypothetical protein
MSEETAKCHVPRIETVDGVTYKVLDRKDTCYPVQRVLAKHQGVKLVTPEEFAALTKGTT